MILSIEVNHTDIQVELLPSSSSKALEELLKSGPLVIPMKDYAHMEKFGDLGVRLPRNDQHITTKAGDVILSEGNLLVIYYAPNTWNFTRLGRVVNLTEKELKKCWARGILRQHSHCTQNRKEPNNEENNSSCNSVDACCPGLHRMQLVQRIQRWDFCCYGGTFVSGNSSGTGTGK